MQKEMLKIHPSPGCFGPDQGTFAVATDKTKMAKGLKMCLNDVLNAISSFLFNIKVPLKENDENV